ncbi:MAG: hypothetical protein MUE44_02820 [Oscillatoriaceae cyanobacterium Prado104]|nr:hypothetical protein [Oscillatoriaceae cyanobacterium Prado104]
MRSLVISPQVPLIINRRARRKYRERGENIENTVNPDLVLQAIESYLNKGGDRP